MKVTIDSATERAILSNIPAALEPMGFGQMKHAKRLDLLARLLGYRNHEQRVATQVNPPVTIKVTMRCVVPEAQRHPVDREELPAELTEFYQVPSDENEPTEYALDRFHESWGIKMLDDYEIVADRVDGPELNPKPSGEFDPIDQLKARYGGSFGEHPSYPVQDWSYQIANDDTRLGYWEWVLQSAESCEDEVNIQAGARVTFQEGADATWFEVVSTPDSWTIAVRDAELAAKRPGSNVSAQNMDVSLVVQHQAQ